MVSVTHMGNIIQEIQSRDADLVIRDMSIDRAKIEGQYNGRKPTALAQKNRLLHHSQE